MKNDSYDISEKAFMDVWKKQGSPDEINGSENCFKFLEKLIDNTNGWVIVDHFSLANYDRIDRVELKDSFIYVYWRNFEKNL